MQAVGHNHNFLNKLSVLSGCLENGVSLYYFEFNTCIMSCVPQLLFSRPDKGGEIITVEKRPVTALYDKRAKYIFMPFL